MHLEIFNVTIDLEEPNSSSKRKGQCSSFISTQFMQTKNYILIYISTTWIIIISIFHFELFWDFIGNNCFYDLYM